MEAGEEIYPNQAKLMLAMSRSFETGQVFEQDLSAAEDLLKKLDMEAEHNPEIAYLLAVHLLTETVTFKNIKHAIELLNKAIELHSTQAALLLAAIYLKGLHGIPVDADKAFRIVSMPQLEDTPEAQFMLGLCYYENRHRCDADGKKGLDLMSEAAKNGCSDAQYFLEIHRLMNEHKASNFSFIARIWCEEGSLKSEAALSALARAYELGDAKQGIEQNISLALEFYHCAMRLGSLAAECKIGILLQQGLGVKQDSEAAFQRFQSLANKKHPEGTFRLGACFASGNGVARDSKHAFELYEQAALLDEPRALCILGQAHQFGVQGYTKDARKAFGCFLKAATLQHGAAYNLLAKCYEEGIGIDECLKTNKLLRYKLAYQAYCKAASAGVEGIEDSVERANSLWQQELLQALLISLTAPPVQLLLFTGQGTGPTNLMNPSHDFAEGEDDMNNNNASSPKP